MSDIVEEDQVIKEDPGHHVNSRKGWNVKKVEAKNGNSVHNSVYKTVNQVCKKNHGPTSISQSSRRLQTSP